MAQETGILSSLKTLLRNAPALRSLVAGALAAAPYAVMRGTSMSVFAERDALLAVQKARAESRYGDVPEQYRPLSSAELTLRLNELDNTLTMRVINRVQSLPVISGLLKGKDDATAEGAYARLYTEFVPSFTFFTAGLTYGRKLLDRWVDAPQTAEESPEPSSIMDRLKQAAKGISKFILKHPVGVAVAILPYSLMNRFADEAIAPSVKDATRDKNLDGIASLYVKTAMSFSTFNVSFQLWGQMVDHWFGDSPQRQAEQAANDGSLARSTREEIERPSLQKRIRQTVELATGTVIPVSLGVTPLVASLYATNTQAQNVLAQRLNAQENTSLLDHMHYGMMECGKLLKSTSSLATQPFLNPLKDTLNISDENLAKASGFILPAMLAYGTYAATRAAITPLVPDAALPQTALRTAAAEPKEPSVT